jgi:uncharacterized GH25 family protein
MPRTIVRIVVTLWVGVAAVPALAHEYWLAPNRYRAAAGDTITIGAWVGTGFVGMPRPYSRGRALRFERFDPDSSDLLTSGRNGDATWTRFVARGAGGIVIAYESDFAEIVLPAEEFDEYLATEGLEEPLRIRRVLGEKAGPGRERYARCAKTWIAGESALALLTPRGLTLEIVPLANPATSDSLEVRVLFQGKPLPGALVRAWHQRFPADGVGSASAKRDSTGPACNARTNPNGVALLQMRNDGEWLVGVVHMVSCPAPDQADWQSYWASLTFARPHPNPDVSRR